MTCGHGPDCTLKTAQGLTPPAPSSLCCPLGCTCRLCVRCLKCRTVQSTYVRTGNMFFFSPLNSSVRAKTKVHCFKCYGTERTMFPQRFPPQPLSTHLHVSFFFFSFTSDERFMTVALPLSDISSIISHITAAQC